jgi:hypothetical protein
MKISQILENMPRAARGKNQELKIHRYGKEPFDPSRPEDYYYEYHFEYDVNGGDFSQEFIEAHKKTDYDNFQEVWAYIEDDNGVDKADQKLIKKGEDAIWMGYKLGEIESHTDEDEDGKYAYVTGGGDAWIISTKQLDNAQLIKLSGELEKGLDKDASMAIDDAHDARRDAEEYARDPYAYYGVSRSDFM